MVHASWRLDEGQAGGSNPLTCMDMPVVEQSMLQSSTSSFIASTILIRVSPASKRASNMAAGNDEQCQPGLNCTLAAPGKLCRERLQSPSAWRTKTGVNVLSVEWLGDTFRPPQPRAPGFSHTPPVRPIGSAYTHTLVTPG